MRYKSGCLEWLLIGLWVLLIIHAFYKTIKVNADEYTQTTWNEQDFVATAYCGCENCSEGWGSLTATGTTATAGRTIAVDPKIIPLGSAVCIYVDDELLGIFIAEDVGGAIKGNKIDIFFDTHEECKAFGKRQVQVVIYENAKG